MEPRFPACFVSCSFDPQDASVVSWFEKVLINLDFDTRKADTPQPRPPPEKIAEMIQNADCFVAIVTKRLKVEQADQWVGPDWVQNEIGMAYHAGKPMAIFVEKGVEFQGVGKWVGDYVWFERTDLGACAPNVVKYLLNLSRTVTRSQVGRAEDIPTARAVLNELANLATLVDQANKPTSFPWHLAFLTGRLTGRFYMLPISIQNSVMAAYSALEEFEELAKPPFALRKPESFPPNQTETIAGSKTKVGSAVGTAIVELMQFAYPEEWLALVLAVQKGALPPKRSD